MDQHTNFKRKIIIASSLFLVICFLFLVIWNGIYLPKEPYSSEMVIFSVEKGEGSKEISINLEKEELIKYGTLFRLYVLHKSVAVKLQAGKYLLSPSMNIPEIVNKFATGDVIKEKITIVEGWSLIDIEEYLSEKGLIKGEELFVLAGYPMADYLGEERESNPKDFSEEFDFLKDKPRTIMVRGKSKNLGLEGYIFPDTYEIVKGESLEALIRKILRNFDKKLTPEIRDKIEKQGKTIFEIVTMASLIEKEVRFFDDRQIVSGILWKRIKSNMPLQVDATITATITYITGETTTKVSVEETKIDSPYNTYKYLGLPPGPISNPGLESIRAAIYPRESDYWFYLSKPDGETVFSKTLQEHNQAKERYLK